MGKVHYTPEQVAANKANAAPYKERRLALGLSQKQLAQKAGIDESGYRRMELGQSVPIWETRQKIRRVLGMPEEGLKIVNACLRIIEQVKPVWWALENPVGYLRDYLGKSTLIFQPWEYGDPWTKRTEIWGVFKPPPKQYFRWEDVPNKLPLYTRPGRGKPNFAYLHKSALSLIPQLAFADPKTDADFRAITPPGFAKAFFEANR